jgi:hypothetical protein
MIATVKRQRHQSLIDHRKSNRHVFQVKRRFSEDHLASQQRLRNAARHLRCPAWCLSLAFANATKKPVSAMPFTCSKTLYVPKGHALPERYQQAA